MILAPIFISYDDRSSALIAGFTTLPAGSLIKPLGNIFGHLGVSFSAPAISFLPELFPVQERYSSFSFGLNFGQSILRMTTPLIATFLVSKTGFFTAPAFYLIVTSIMSLFSVISAKSFKENSKGALDFVGNVRT